jgi:hypothetical protein
VKLHAIEATRSTRCGICEDQIVEGELIVNVDDEWVHAGCADEEGHEVVS